MNAPLITIFVHHSPDCNYAGDKFSKRCDCRKHFRWSKGRFFMAQRCSSQLRGGQF
jgi:hypothetical protein